jgi:hypothetical protein
MARCPTASLDVRVTFLDLRYSPGIGGISKSVPDLVSDLFRVLVITSFRWRSFFLMTEHPQAFHLVQQICQGLYAPELVSLNLQYLYMDGFSGWDDQDPIYEQPFIPADWFNNSHCVVNRLVLNATVVNWASTGIFDNLVSLDVSQGHLGHLCLGWSFFTTLFNSAAFSLKHLRLGEIQPFRVPPSASLYSPVLVVLDVSLDINGNLDSLMAVLDAPKLEDLTLRTIHDSFHLVLPLKQILGQLVRLSIHGDVCCSGDAYPLPTHVAQLYELYDSMPNLEVLDFSHSEYHVFHFFAEWYYTRSAARQAVPVPRIKSLALPVSDISSLREFLEFMGAREDRDGTHMILRHVRVDRLVASWETEDLNWLAEHISDFARVAPLEGRIAAHSGPTLYSSYVFD